MFMQTVVICHYIYTSFFQSLFFLSRIYNENTNSDVYCNILDNYLILTVELYKMKINYIYEHHF
jgi:hypothetical protein